MRDANFGAWAREPHLSGAILESLRELNLRFLVLAAARARVHCDSPRSRPPPQFAGQLAALSVEQKAAAANCPYALFDLRFEDDGHWQSCLQNASPWRVADQPGADADAAHFVQLALFYVWHVASTARLAAQLILGMNEGTVAAFGRMTLNRLPALAATETINLTARWCHCTTYWNSLLDAAARPDEAQLRRAQLFGFQLAAAARLHRPSGQEPLSSP